MGKDLKKTLSRIPGNTDRLQDSRALQGGLTGETMAAAAALGSGSKGAGKELAIPKLTPQCQRQTGGWKRNAEGVVVQLWESTKNASA